jgi:hypothetical protein
VIIETKNNHGRLGQNGQTGGFVTKTPGISVVIRKSGLILNSELLVLGIGSLTFLRV